MFYCNICRKYIWDAVSFELHIQGRTHMMMRQLVEEGYVLRANMIRQEAKIEEQLKQNEIDRRSRDHKIPKGRREFCTMCGFYSFRHSNIHRKTNGHMKLKAFLHPRCSDCFIEFPNRIDFDNHLLTPVHMKKAHANKSDKLERRKNALIIRTEEDELKDVNYVRVINKENETVNKDEGAEKAINTEDALKNAQIGVTEIEDYEEKRDSTVEVNTASEPENVILDVKEDEEVPIDIKKRIPQYNCNRPIGSSQIHHLDCFECYICNRFFDTERTAEVHTCTVTHHRNFVNFLVDKSNETKFAQRCKEKKPEDIFNAPIETKNGNDIYDPCEDIGENEKSYAVDEIVNANIQILDGNVVVMQYIPDPVVPATIEPKFELKNCETI